ncbi:MAG: hypothetical protein K2L52_01600 [Clostridia bacterium]|nr:hypothetical protein [Clostridia bacterium]
MNKELQELEARIKKERSRIMKERMRQMYNNCCEVYEDVSIVELRLIWYIRQFKRYTPQYWLDVAKYVYRAKLHVDKMIDEEKRIEILDKEDFEN